MIWEIPTSNIQRTFQISIFNCEISGGLDLEADSFGERSLPCIEGDEFGCAERYSETDVEQVEAANAELFHVRSGKILCFAERVGPRDGRVGQDIIGQVRFDFAKSLCALLGSDFPAKDPQADACAKFMAMEWSKRKRFLISLEPSQSGLGVGLW